MGCKDPNPKAPHTCGSVEYKGDGDCGAKSVGGPVKKDYCNECKCKDPKASPCGSPDYKGDGNCDDDNNNKECGYDGGDCCAESVGGPVLKAYCNECKCKDPKYLK